jgi:hypothetical protein
MFRAEIAIRGDTKREQRDRIAAALRLMAVRVESSDDPLVGSPHVTIVTDGQLAGTGFFELGQGRLVA